MKLKKRQFARLKDIAEAVNHVLPGTGIKLDKLIADIESVQKVKTIKEKPLMESLSVEGIKNLIDNLGPIAIRAILKQHRQDVENDFIKQGASSSDPNIPFTRGLRDAVEAVTKPNKISDFLDEALVLSNKDPKIGDVGYFWGDDCYHALYGKIIGILPGIGHIYGIFFNETILYYSNFSKTPPELK